MTVPTIQTTVVFDLPPGINLAKLVDELREWAQEEALFWRVSRAGADRISVVSSMPATVAVNGSTSALAWTCGDVDRALSSLDVKRCLGVVRVQTSLFWASKEEKGDD